jgi:hypothetical protein
VGPVDEWLAGRFDAWLWVVIQDDEWITGEDFAVRLAGMWRDKGETAGVRYELADAGQATLGERQHAVWTALRTTTPASGDATRSLDVYAPTGGRQVSLSFTSRADTFERWLPSFRAWSRTLDFARPPRGEPTLTDKLWGPVITGALVGLLLWVLHRYSRRR